MTGPGDLGATDVNFHATRTETQPDNRASTINSKFLKSVDERLQRIRDRMGDVPEISEEQFETTLRNAMRAGRGVDSK